MEVELPAALVVGAEAARSARFPQGMAGRVDTQAAEAEAADQPLPQGATHLAPEEMALSLHVSSLRGNWYTNSIGVRSWVIY